MTKRVIAAVALIAAALAVSCGSLRYVDKVGNTLVGYLTTAQERHEQGGDYKKPLEQAEMLWQEKREMLGVLLKHSDADEMEQFFYKIEKYMETGDTEKLFETVEDCRAAVEVILRGEAPAARNVF